MSHAKITKQKTAFKAKLFEVKENSILSRNGKILTHHDVYKKRSVFVFPLVADKEVYLISQYRYLLGETVIESVAGFVEDGESTLSAARRELKEETGLQAGQIEEIARLNIAGSVIASQIFIFLARDIEKGVATPEEDEEIELIKLPISHAIEKIFSGEIKDVATVAGLLLIQRMIQEKKL